MRLELRRKWLTDNWTLGELRVDGDFAGYTLEDKVRADGVKVPGKTAIPASTYTVVFAWSPHFDRMMPTVLGVPNFSRILIHPGNSADDSRGCILIGTTAHQKSGTISGSRDAFARLVGRLEKADDRILIAIINDVVDDRRSNGNGHPKKE